MTHLLKIRFDLLIALVIVFPAIGWRFDLIGASEVDVWNHAWGPWWWAHNFTQFQLPWNTPLLHAPDGGTLWFIDPALALIAAPIALFSPAFGFFVALLLYFGFASYSIRQFARTLGAGEETQWIASIGFVCSAWVLSEANNGITEALNIGTVAWALHALAKAQQNSTMKNWIFCGIFIGLSTACSPYLGMGVGIIALIFGVFHLRWSWLGGVTAGVISAPTLILFKLQLQAGNAIIKRPEGMNETLALHNGVDPRTFIAPFGFQSVDLSHEGFVHSMYLGWVLLFLACLNIRKHRLWIFAALVSILCALGPYLYWGDNWFIADGARFRLPWFYLQQIFSGLAVTHPLRLGIPALAIVAALAAANLEHSSFKKYWKHIAFLVALDGLIISGAPFPVDTSSSDIPECYADIKSDPRDIIVLDLPTDSGSTMRTSQYLFFQTHHQKGIPYAPDVRASTSNLLRNAAFRELAALCNRRADEHQRLGLGGPSSANSNLMGLKNASVGWIVVHHTIDPSVTQSLINRIEKDLGEGEVINETTRWKMD
jgi:hypothetical protein